MKQTDYPALYQSASELSQESQASFFRAFLGHITFLVLAAVISVINSSHPGFAIAQAMVLFGALLCAIYLYSARPDRHWYSSRAVAESIKTITWRYMLRAEPFSGTDEMARHEFSLRLKSIVKQNKDIAGRLATHLDGVQIPLRMEEARQLGAAERLRNYRQNRIAEQQSWYANKAAFNKRMVNRFFAALIGTIVASMAFAIAKVQYPTVTYWPTDVLVTLAAGILSWIQARRFQELAVSYALAAHEISLIREQSGNAMSDDALSRFVGDAENAFSREHTQWIARQDI